MEAFVDYLSKLEDPVQRERVESVLTWVAETFPKLEPRVAWNQPMFTDHGTFIIGFSTAMQHMACAPERIVIQRFAEEIVKSGYSHTQELFRIRWTDAVDWALLERIIAFNILDKADCRTFWRK